MKFQLTPQSFLIMSKLLGLSLLLIFRVGVGEAVGFFLILALLGLFLLRHRLHRMKKIDLTIFIDCMLCILFMNGWNHVGYALPIVLFEAMARKKYLALLTLVYFYTSPEFLLLSVISSLGGYFLGCWCDEKENDLKRRFELKGQIYELESLRNETTNEIFQVERMATVAERARISRDIHDHAGHDIIAAYISFQTLQSQIKDPEVLEIYEMTLERLSDGVGKIRDILHNLTPVGTPSIKQLEKICETHPLTIEWGAYGNTDDVPTYIWNALSTCLKEALTNVSRHAVASYVKVQLDASTHIIRLYVENDGVQDHTAPAGRGVTNLKYRLSSIGGNLSVNKENGIFKLIGVIPLEKEGAINESNFS